MKLIKLYRTEPMGRHVELSLPGRCIFRLSFIHHPKYSPLLPFFTPPPHLPDLHSAFIHLPQRKPMATRGRKTVNGVSEPQPGDDLSRLDSSPGTSSISALLTTPATGVERDEVKVNNASVTEMKHACDDALKRVSTVFSAHCPRRRRPSATQQWLQPLPISANAVCALRDSLRLPTP